MQLGFASFGITDLAPTAHHGEFDRWLKNGMAGTMGYLPRQAAKRKEPSQIVPGATRAILVTRLYTPDHDAPPRPGYGRVASYARGPDYHETLEGPLEQLADVVRSLGHRETIAKPFVDAGPVPERELAQRAGLGWIGKNTMLIDPARGSFFFIASIFTNLELPIDQPYDTDRCGSCTRCLDACPTNAFPEERVLDANKCISYLTIEWKGEITADRARSFEGWVFGCDICQTVCPWNVKFARPVNDEVLGLDGAYAELDLEALINMTPEDFDHRFDRTPLNRPGVNGMRRNASAVKRAAENP